MKYLPGPRRTSSSSPLLTENNGGGRAGSTRAGRSMNQTAVSRRTPAWARPVRATLWEIIPGLAVAAAGSDGVSFAGMRESVLVDLRTRVYNVPDVPIGCLYLACPMQDGQTI